MSFRDRVKRGMSSTLHSIAKSLPSAGPSRAGSRELPVTDQDVQQVCINVCVNVVSMHGRRELPVTNQDLQQVCIDVCINVASMHGSRELPVINQDLQQMCISVCINVAGRHGSRKLPVTNQDLQQMCINVCINRAGTGADMSEAALSRGCSVGRCTASVPFTPNSTRSWFYLGHPTGCSRATFGSARRPVAW